MNSLRRLTLSFLGLGLLMSLGTVSAAQTEGTPFIGTWSTATTIGPDGQNFAQQTLRQIVHTSIAGQRLRLRVSNVFGTQPLVLDDLQLAAPAGGSSILPNSSVSVLFNGQRRVTVAPGELAVSDPVDYAVAADSDLAVSFYVVSAQGPSSYHQMANQQSWSTRGDASALAQWPQASSFGQFPYLSGVEVQNPQAIGAVVAIGASLTDGASSSFDQPLRWPNRLARRLLADGQQVGVLNQGNSGNQLLHDGAGEAEIHRFQRDVLDQPGVRWVILSDDPINDLTSNVPVPTASALIGGLTDLVNRAHDQQLRVLCSTLTPYQGYEHWTSEQESVRQQFNSFLRSAGSGCDAVVDQDLATHDPAHPNQFLPAYDSGDHLHPNDAGYAAIANAVNLDIFRQPTPLPPMQAPARTGLVLPGEGLTPGGLQMSDAQNAGFVLQGSGDLVIYQFLAPGQGNLIGFYHLSDNGVPRLQLRSGGNLVAYADDGRAVWATNSVGHAGAYLYMQNDGNLVIYDVLSDGRSQPIWASGTSVR
jgi:lysophospholipase L1-like esterase